MPLNIEKLSMPLENYAGMNLRYEPVYDQIKSARFEEDASLSRGVWKRDLKKADWNEVYKLCVRALENDTKDLQLVGWLCEATCRLEQWDGLRQSIDLAHSFCENCWDFCYPEPGEDLEYRVRILDWFVEKMAECSLFMPIAPANGLVPHSLDLSTWLAAQNFDLVARRSGISESRAQDAENAGQITLKRFRLLMRQANTSNVSYVLSLVEEIRDKSLRFSELLHHKCNGISPSFKRFHEQLESVSQLCKSSLEGRVPQATQQVTPNQHDIIPVEFGANAGTYEESSAPTADVVDGEILYESVDAAQNQAQIQAQAQAAQAQPQESGEEITINGRQDAYKAIEELADYLIEVDPQSPGPYLIKMVSSWAGKPLPVVLDDVITGGTEGHKILKMLSEVMRRGAA
ncbi:MAG: type VI secretion system ImpA family N-terminal domain-containing protein [Holosporales bacterium]|jgi:type VI secretion system ImpA family protein|nr:type VI secretion system ImpA family N-terminal domain-containing protein [Holosporales bacterium]